jgi:hypothetical protein
MSAAHLILNAIAFQLAWFAALYGGILNSLSLALFPAMIVAAWHLYQMRALVRPEFALFLILIVLGFVFESVFIALGAITFVGSPLFGFGPPLWILAMWLAFATLPNGCLAWLKGKWVLQILLGGLTGPLSYLAGGKLGGATLHEPVLQSLAIIGIGWAIALPVIFWVAERLSARQNGA